jgi:CRISPR-associated protein Csb1
LLITLGLYKIRALLDGDLRLRTACDLSLAGEPEVTAPDGFALPTLATLETAVTAAIAENKDSLAGLTTVRYDKKASKASKGKTSKAKAGK